MTEKPKTTRRMRVPKAHEDLLLPVCVRLTASQKEKLRLLGGGLWLREKLRRAAVAA